MDVRHDTDAVAGVVEGRQATHERSGERGRAAPGRSDYTHDVTGPKGWWKKGGHLSVRSRRFTRMSGVPRPLPAMRGAQ